MTFWQEHLLTSSGNNIVISYYLLLQHFSQYLPVINFSMQFLLFFLFFLFLEPRKGIHLSGVIP